MGSAQGGRQPTETWRLLHRSRVVADQHALVLDDPEHSNTEDRFVLLGLSAALRILVVVHCYRAGDSVIRLISARRADAEERRQYDERWI